MMGPDGQLQGRRKHTQTSGLNFLPLRCGPLNLGVLKTLPMIRVVP